MTFRWTLAALVLLALTAPLARAQRGGSSAGHVAGGVHLAVPPASNAVARGPSARSPAFLHPPARAFHGQPGRVMFARPSFAAPSASSSFGLERAPAAAWAIASLRQRGTLAQHSALAPRRFIGWGFPFYRAREGRFPHFPYFFFGGGPSACSPLLPGFFGTPWFDRQFTCFGTPFYGVDFYPQDFLAPELAYEPWLPGLAMSGEEQLGAVADGAFAAGDLDMIASIAARESAESNPEQQVTVLVLKEGISFTVTDYWVEDGKLGYVTTYDRQNTIDLDRLDLDKTVKLNSARGIPFVLTERPAPATPPQ